MLFPAPEWPMTPNISPFSIDRFNPESAVAAWLPFPYTFVIPFRLINARRPLYNSLIPYKKTSDDRCRSQEALCVYLDNAFSSANDHKPSVIVGISTMTFVHNANRAVYKSVAGLHRAYPSATLDKI
ncbi:hypothetical protein D3C71_1588540 [compost metagenome]